MYKVPLLFDHRGDALDKKKQNIAETSCDYYFMNEIGGLLICVYRSECYLNTSA